MKIDTKNLILRTITESDIHDVFEYSSNPIVGPPAGWKPHESLEETKQIMDEVFVGKESIFGIILKESGKLIGTIGLIDDPKRQNPKSRMVGYALGVDYWGKGYMTEACKATIKYGFENLDLDIITCTCYPSNDRSKSVIKKCGFVYEGTLKECELRYDGKILDLECYFLLKNKLNSIM